MDEISNSESGHFEIKIEMQYTSWKNALESWFLSKFPLFFQNLKGYIFIWRSCFESNYTIVWVISVRQIILRCFLFVIQIWVKNVEFVTLDWFWRWVILSISMHTAVPHYFMSNSHSIQIYWFTVPESPLCLTWYPVIKLLLIFFHSFILLKFDDLFCYLVICHILFSDYLRW